MSVCLYLSVSIGLSFCLHWLVCLLHCVSICLHLSVHLSVLPLHSLSVCMCSSTLLSLCLLLSGQFAVDRSLSLTESNSLLCYGACLLRCVFHQSSFSVSLPVSLKSCICFYRPSLSNSSHPSSRHLLLSLFCSLSLINLTSLSSILSCPLSSLHDLSFSLSLIHLSVFPPSLLPSLPLSFSLPPFPLLALFSSTSHLSLFFHRGDREEAHCLQERQQDLEDAHLLSGERERGKERGGERGRERKREREMERERGRERERQGERWREGERGGERWREMEREGGEREK